jgi:lipopolysaccharide biosynthesis protein
MLKLKNLSGANFSTGITHMESQQNTTSLNNLQMTKWFYTQSNNLNKSLLLYKNSLEIPITSFLSANTDYQMNLINPVHLNLLRYGIKFNGPCKCMELDLMISHKVKLQNTAVMLSLNINKF